MTREYTLETIAIVTNTRVETLRELAEEGYLDARPHRTYLVSVGDDEELRDVVVGAMARKTSPADHLDLS